MVRLALAGVSVIFIIAETKYSKYNVYLAHSLHRFQPIIGWLQGRVPWQKGNSSYRAEGSKAMRDDHSSFYPSHPIQAPQGR